MNETQLYRSNQRTKPLRLKGEKILYSISVGVIITLFGVYISSRQANALEYGYQLEELTEQTNRLKDEQRILKSELAFLKDPKRVISKSSAMNLEPMQQQYWVYQNGRDLNLEDEATLLE